MCSEGQICLCFVCWIGGNHPPPSLIYSCYLDIVFGAACPTGVIIENKPTNQPEYAQIKIVKKKNLTRKITNIEPFENALFLRCNSGQMNI